MEDVKVPVLVTYPADNACAKPYKTIIFQHGITTDRTSTLGFANQMAAFTSGCYATVAIDHPVHGVDASTLPRSQYGSPTLQSILMALTWPDYIDAGDQQNSILQLPSLVLRRPQALSIHMLAPDVAKAMALNAAQQPVSYEFC